MNIQQYTREASRTCPDLGSAFNNQLHMVVGIATEAGELLDAYKKNFAYGKPIDIVNVAEEIGDLFWYIFNLCNMLDIDPERIMDMCIEKLRARYPEKFTQENALNRDLEKERKILEDGL